MKIYDTGKLADRLHAIGNIGFPAFLLLGDEEAFMLDAGVSAMGPIYYQEILRLIDDPKKLSTLFISHSHFDHVGAVPYLKNRLPQLQIAAAPSLTDTLGRPAVEAKIRQLNLEYERFYLGAEQGPETAFHSFPVDIPLKDGMKFSLDNGLSMQVLSVPGHTWDSTGFYFPHAKALAPGESAGMPDENLNIMPEFLADYEDYMASLEKMAALEVELLLLPHGQFLTGEDAANYIPRSIKGTAAFRRKIEAAVLKYGEEREKVAAAILEDPVARSISMQQGEKAFLLNLKAQINTVTQILKNQEML